jgi:hypothetical protein
MIEHYGDIIELNHKINDNVIGACSSISQWQTEKTREYIDLIGSLDQDYRGKDEEDLNYNANMDLFPQIKSFLGNFDEVYKARIMKISAGSFFEPHRDHFQGGKRFRILIPLNNTTRDKYAFFYEDRIIEFKPCVPYILNTRKVHGAMSFADNTYHVIASVNNTQENQRKVIDLMTFR